LSYISSVAATLTLSFNTVTCPDSRESP